ncbi:MAG: hypothetical protein K2J29_03090, partial [Muribaculaceae bacterium]|nr:hypothetical protein [Muribaculaceae bacterium]
CVSLRRVVLPANKSLLGELILSGCSSLEEVVEMSPVPPPFDCNSPLFDPDDTAAWTHCRLTVPAGARNAYSRAPGWRLFFSSAP